MAIDTQQIWRTTLAQIEIKLDAPVQYKTFFQDTELLEIKAGKATICVPNQYISDWLQRKYESLISSTINYVYGQELKLEFIATKTTKHSSSQQTNQEQSIDTNPFMPFQQDTMEAVLRTVQASGLNEKYTMQNFLVGDANRMAHAAALAVTEGPGSTYNPLFLHGKTGVGKTHLAQAIGRAIIERSPSKKVIYTPSEGFLTDMVDSLRRNRMAEFRTKYRSKNVLIIDDIQLISKWVKTQDEFFNTFNELQAQNNQIILVSDRRPEEIKDIEDRLRSRFQGGMVISMEEPDYELRLAILERKAKQSNIELSTRILEVIARSISDNVRELEGALQTVALFNRMKNDGDLTVEEVERIIGADAKSKREKIKVPVVLKYVAKAFDVTVKDIKGDRRTKDIASARQVAMYILRDELGYKLQDVAHAVRRTDHTTVMHAADKIKSQMATAEGFRNQIVDIIKQIHESTEEVS